MKDDDIRTIKILWATHGFIHRSRRFSSIAEAVGEKPSTILRWCQTAEWQAALDYWEYEGKAKVKLLGHYIRKKTEKRVDRELDDDVAGDFDRCLMAWKRLIKQGADLYPSDADMDEIARRGSEGFIGEESDPEQ